MSIGNTAMHTIGNKENTRTIKPINTMGLSADKNLLPFIDTNKDFQENYNSFFLYFV